MTFHIGTPHTRGSGYLINGQNLTRPYEADIQTCAHCQAVIELQKKDFGWCQREMKPLCHACGITAHTQGCVPFMKTLEAFAQQQLRYTQISKLAAYRPLILP
jgi:hypothetical protein